MLSHCLHGNDNIRSEENGANSSFDATVCMFTAVKWLGGLFFIFDQHKPNVCDFGGKPIRLEDTV